MKKTSKKPIKIKAKVNKIIKNYKKLNKNQIKSNKIIYILNI